MALEKEDITQIGMVVGEQLAPITREVNGLRGEVAELRGRMDEHVRANGVAASKPRGLVGGIGSWLQDLTGWQRVVAIVALCGTVLGTIALMGGVPGL